MKSPDEEYAKNSFHNFLVRELSIEQLSWKESETPDFYLNINNSTFGLEITSLMSSLNKENINLPIAAIYAITHEIKTRISECAKSLDMLDGAYLLRINKPIKINKSEKNKIIKNAVKYIQESQKTLKRSSLVLFHKNSANIEIEKIHSKKQYVGITGPTITRWEGEAKEEIYNILQERIISKAKKLDKVNLPKILVLLDRYHFADYDQYREAILEIQEKNKFNLIFLVGQEYKGISLYGEEPFLSNVQTSTPIR